MIEITEKKAHKLSEHLEEGLRHIGKAMQCVDAWFEDSSMGERDDRYGMPHKYGKYHGDMAERYIGHRGPVSFRDEWDEEEMGERRRRDSRGRYM